VAEAAEEVAAPQPWPSLRRCLQHREPPALPPGLQHSSVGARPLTKLHQLGPADKMYSYCLIRPSQARDRAEGKAKPGEDRKQTAGVSDHFGSHSSALEKDVSLEPSAETSPRISGQEPPRSCARVAREAQLSQWPFGNRRPPPSLLSLHHGYQWGLGAGNH